MIVLKKRNTLGAIKSLKPGESCFFEIEASHSEQSIRASAANCGTQSGRKFSCRAGYENGIRGIRVFRLS